MNTIINAKYAQKNIKPIYGSRTIWKLFTEIYLTMTQNPS
jgi:hypothetical protein